MPLGETLSGFFYDEYQRFMRGLDTLSQPDRVYTGAAARRQAQNAALPRQISIPAWDDVFHLVPRLQVTPDQTAEYRRAVARGFTPSLPPEVTTELQRREFLYTAMQRSTQPEFDRAWGSVMTAIDNVQDFAGALSVLGRIALSVGARVGLRAIPGLGQLVLASDVLNAAMFLGQLAFPSWLLFCAGWRSALRAGLGTALTAATFKGGSALLARGASASTRWTLRNPLSVRGIAGAIGAALVVGQTTDQLFGYGISLGPIVGGTMGAAYGLEATTRGVRVEVVSSPSVEHFWPRIHPRLRDVPTSALLDRMQAANTLALAGLILHPASPAPANVKLLTAGVLPAAVGVLWHDWQETGWQDDLPRFAGWAVPAFPAAPVTVPWQSVIGERARLAPTGWPRSWGEGGYDVARVADRVATDLAAGLNTLAEGQADPTTRAFVAAAARDATEALWLLVTGDPEALRPKLTPPWLALERMAAVGFLIHPRGPVEKVQPFWNEAVRRVENSAHGMQTRAEWQQLADAHDIIWTYARAADLVEPETP